MWMKLLSRISAPQKRRDFLGSHNPPLVIDMQSAAPRVAVSVFPPFHSAHHHNKGGFVLKNKNLLL
jgi:hypothetical protein